MDPIDLLVDEHRTILAVLDALEAWARRLPGGADPADLEGFVAFLREFADACHHGKEEDLLFVAMVAHGFPREAGPVAVMLAEHDDGRAHVRALAERIGTAGAWTGDEQDAVVRHALAFAALLRAHIQKEDHVLYPMALRHLPPEALAALAGDFERFEAARTGTARHGELLALADRLVARHRPAAP